MKKVLLVLVAMLLVCAGVVLADETSQANWNNDLGRFGDRLRESTTGHSHAYDLPDLDRNIEYGPGVDVIVYEKDGSEPTGNKPVKFIKKFIVPDSVTSENRVDFGNKEYKTYLVATYHFNVVSKIGNLFKKKVVEVTPTE
jgi:hypothetical protein